MSDSLCPSVRPFFRLSSRNNLAATKRILMKFDTVFFKSVAKIQVS